jgi:hypothetical protein
LENERAGALSTIGAPVEPAERNEPAGVTLHTGIDLPYSIDTNVLRGCIPVALDARRIIDGTSLEGDMKIIGLIVAGMGSLLLTGCSSDVPPGAPSKSGGPTSPSQQESTAQGNVKVDSVRVFIKDGRLQAFVQGEIGDGCTSLQPMKQTRDGNVVNVNVSSIRQGEVCTMIMQLLNGWVPLTGTFEPGAYTLRANAATIGFTLTRDGGGQLTISPAPGPVPDGPTYQ